MRAGETPIAPLASPAGHSEVLASMQQNGQRKLCWPWHGWSTFDARKALVALHVLSLLRPQKQRSLRLFWEAKQVVPNDLCKVELTNHSTTRLRSMAACLPVRSEELWI